jgi:predicted XRE-type DNA-binding protein
MLRMNQQTTNAPVLANVWDALADTPEAAANLRLRSELMRQINALIEPQGLSQTQAAQATGKRWWKPCW